MAKLKYYFKNEKADKLFENYLHKVMNSDKTEYLINDEYNDLNQIKLLETEIKDPAFLYYFGAVLYKSGKIKEGLYFLQSAYEASDEYETNGIIYHLICSLIADIMIEQYDIETAKSFYKKSLTDFCPEDRIFIIKDKINLCDEFIALGDNSSIAFRDYLRKNNYISELYVGLFQEVMKKKYEIILDELISNGLKNYYLTVCPNCKLKGYFKIKIFGLISDPNCKHKWILSPFQYIDFKWKKIVNYLFYGGADSDGIISMILFFIFRVCLILVIHIPFTILSLIPYLIIYIIQNKNKKQFN